jgi:hypothetical protein
MAAHTPAGPPPMMSTFVSCDATILQGAVPFFPEQDNAAGVTATAAAATETSFKKCLLSIGQRPEVNWLSVIILSKDNIFL